MTWMRRGLLVWVMVASVAACGRGTPPPTDDPGDSPSQPEPQNQPPSQPAPQVISGSLKIHTRFWETGSEAKDVYVQLGDGSRFFKRLDASGDVTFEDPSLVGPQDVTLVAHYDNGFSHAYTYLALERPEVWLPFEANESPAQNPQRAFISGKVTGMREASSVFVYAVGRGARGFSYVNADGSFRIQLQGAQLPAVVDLFAIEEDMGDPFEGKKVVGLKRGITAPAWQHVSGHEIALDHPVDQQARLTVQGAQVYQQESGSAWLAFYQDGQYLFDMFDHAFWQRGIPSTVPTLALTAPFDTTRAMLLLTAGSAYELPSGSAGVRVPVENISSVTASLPKPMTLTSPTALGNSSAPAPVPPYSPTHLVFQWSRDAAAQWVQFSITPDYGNSYAKLSWTVTAPGSVTSLKPFGLRKDEMSFLFPYFDGVYRISLNSRFNGTSGRYADFFTQKPTTDPLEPTWWTSLEGSLDFK